MIVMVLFKIYGEVALCTGERKIVLMFVFAAGLLVEPYVSVSVYLFCLSDLMLCTRVYCFICYQRVRVLCYSSLLGPACQTYM